MKKIVIGILITEITIISGIVFAAMMCGLL